MASLLKTIKFGRRVYSALELEINFSASAAVGSAGIAPFCVVHIAPQAFANVKASLIFGSFFIFRFSKAKVSAK